MKKFFVAILVAILFLIVSGGVTFFIVTYLGGKKELPKVKEPNRIKEEPVAFQTISKGNSLPWLIIDSEKTTVTKKIFRDEKSWREFLLVLEKAVEQKKITPFKMPSIDFQKEMVIGIFSYASGPDLKTYVSGIEKVTVKRTSQRLPSQKLVVSIIKELSGEPTAPLVLYSHHLIKLKKIDLPIEFVITTQTMR